MSLSKQNLQNTNFDHLILQLLYYRNNSQFLKHHTLNKKLIFSKRLFQEQNTRKPAMSRKLKALDSLDRKILSELQLDNSLSLDELASRVGSTKTPVWNRIKRLRENDVIMREVAVLSPDAMDVSVCFFVLIKTSQHEKEWQAKFLTALDNRPEILEAHRLAGDIDYLLKVRVKDPSDYDRFYQALVADISVFNVTSLLSMQEIRSTTALHFTLDNK